MPSLIYKFLPPRTVTAKQSPALILLHGRGADENDLLGLAPELDERLMLFSVRAPYPFPFGGFAWFDLDEQGNADPKMFMESYNRLFAFLDEITTTHAIDTKKIFLMGFSMGTIMAYAMALTKPERFAGVIVQSGFLREIPELELKWNELQHCPFIITHGIQDTIIPVTWAQKTRDMFAARSNAEVVYKEYQMGHQISDASVASVMEWLEKKL
ncbi:MAG: alpha/beta hydrolase [Bacteroidota bacterium]|nr:alpha/beta hydrolase [Bacteroidota bacterium]